MLGNVIRGFCFAHKRAERWQFVLSLCHRLQAHVDNIGDLFFRGGRLAQYRFEKLKGDIANRSSAQEFTDQLDMPLTGA